MQPPACLAKLLVWKRAHLAGPLLFLFGVLSIPLAVRGGPMAQKTNGHAKDNAEEQALIIWMKLSDGKSGNREERERIFKLEDEILGAIERSGSGEYDGNEIGEGFFTLYMYGPSAKRLWEVASPIVKKFRAPAGSYAIIRYGKPGAEQHRLSLSD